MTMAVMRRICSSWIGACGDWPDGRLSPGKSPSRTLRSAVHGHRNRDTVGEDVAHSRTGLRLPDNLGNLLGRCVGLDPEADPDRREAVADLVRQAEDALQVNVALDGTLHRHQGDATRSGDGRDAG